MRRRPTAARPGGSARHEPGARPRRRRGLRRLPAVHRARLSQRAGRPVAAVAPHAPPPRGHAVDLERRRRDELRDARVGEPAARVRPREARRRPDRRPPRARGRDVADARRHRAHAPACGSPHHGRREGGGTRRDHGRARLRGLRRDHRPAARGGELRADRRPPDIRAAGTPDGGLEQVGEGRRPVCGRAGGRAREPAPGRPRGRRADRLRRRERRAARAPGGDAAPRALAGGDRPRRAGRRAAVDPRATRLRRRRGMARDGADLPRARRDAGDRRHRGGRASGPRPRAEHDAAQARRRGPPLGRAAVPPRARGRARRRRVLRGVHLEPRARRSRPGGVASSRPDERRARGVAHDAAARPPRGGARQRRRRQSEHPALRDGAGLPPVRRATAERTLDASGGSRRAVSLRPAARWKRSTGRSTCRSRRGARRSRSSTREKPPRRTPAGWASSTRRCSKERGACSSWMSRG